MGNLETKQKESDEANSRAVNDLKENLADVEKNVTAKLMDEIQPTLGAMKDEIQENVNSNMRRLIQEELALQSYAVKKAGDEVSKTIPTDESSGDETEDAENAKAKGEPTK